MPLAAGVRFSSDSPCIFHNAQCIWLMQNTNPFMLRKSEMLYLPIKFEFFSRYTHKYFHVLLLIHIVSFEC